jgi:hypothetical protein
MPRERIQDDTVHGREQLGATVVDELRALLADDLRGAGEVSVPARRS